jgi:hypothetical protein
VRKVHDVCHQRAFNLARVETKIEVAERYWMGMSRGSHNPQGQEKECGKSQGPRF